MPDGVMKRGKRFGARIHLGGGEYEWVGTFDTEEEAVAARQARIDRGSGLSRETVGEFATLWMDRYPRNKKTTIKKNRGDAARLGRTEIGSKLPHEVTRQEARALSNSHPNLIQAARAMFGDMLKDDLIDSNPFVGLNMKHSKGRKNIEPLTVPEVEMLAELAIVTHGEGYGPTFAAWILTAAFAGPRLGEMCGLEWNDLDFKAGEMTIRRRIDGDGDSDLPKNNRIRTVVLPAQAAAAIRLVPRLVNEDRVFTTLEHKRFTPKATHYGIWNPVRTAFEAKLPEARRRELAAVRHPLRPRLAFHELRHFCATYLLDQGLSSADVGYQLGHTDGILVENTYGHPSERKTRERIRAAMKKKATAAPGLRKAANG